MWLNIYHITEDNIFWSGSGSSSGGGCGSGGGSSIAEFVPCWVTGFYPPTSGTAYVNGVDICKDIARARESMGLCPQHDVLFDLLTVQEHLSFFAQVRQKASPVIFSWVIYTFTFFLTYRFIVRFDDLDLISRSQVCQKHILQIVLFFLFCFVLFS